MISTTNPGSMAIIHSDASNQPPNFKRIFICLAASRNGFLEGCRPVIGLDGCHLKGPYRGVLLEAISLDANLQFFPVAYGIMEIEDSQTWHWFLELLIEAAGRDLHHKPWCIISDRQKGLVQAVQTLLPTSSHRMCCDHILQNFQTRFKQTGLRDLLWEAARAANVFEYEAAMCKIKEENKSAWQYLSLLEARNWAFHAMDPRVKCDHITSNFVESFNAWVGEERFKPPITMLEHIRSKVMALIFTRQQIAARWE
ncbi:hypothetical protein UlMin_018662 [Ulmus minor]